MVDVGVQCSLLSSNAAADSLDMSSGEETSAGVMKRVLGMVPPRSLADSVTTSAQCSPSPELSMQSDTDTLAHECDSSDEDYVPDSDIIESHNFIVLGPILVKFHIRTWLIESFPTMLRTWCCGEDKLHFTPVHTLRQLNRDKALFPPLGRVAEFRARYRQIPGCGFRG